MSGLVLLNDEGVVARRLQFVSLPDDYVVPEGMAISWRTERWVSSADPSENIRCREPAEAYFYLGTASGQICRGEVKEYDRDSRSGSMRYASRILTITVQGTLARDVMELRDHILQLIDSGVRWGVSNNLNPEPKIGPLRRLFGMLN